MHVDSNPPVSVSWPLAVQNHNPAPHKDVCNFQFLKQESLVTNQLSGAEFSQVIRSLCGNLCKPFLISAVHFKQKLQTSLCRAGLWFWTANGHDMLIGGFESTRIPQMPLVEIFAPVMLRKLVLQLQDHFSWEILERLSSLSDGAWIHNIII